MFKKLLSNLPFNPSLIGQVSFYSKRLKSESAIRRTGLILLSLAFLVQFVGIFSPAEASNASSTNDIVSGGFKTQAEAAKDCQDNVKNFRDILDYYGVSCDLLASHDTSTITIRSNANNYHSLGRNDQGAVNARTGKTTNQYRVDIPNVGTFYMKDLSSWDSGAYSPYQVLSMTNKYGNQVMVMYDCGNIITIGHYNPPTQTPEDKPVVGSFDDVTCESIWGWAFDESAPTTSIAVHIYIDADPPNGAIGLAANQSRTDVGKAFPEAGNNHGFSMATPASIKDKKSHTIKAYAIGIDANGAINGVNPLLGTITRTLDCSKPPVKPPKTPCPSNPALNVGDVKCTPCPSQPSISIDNADCAPCETIKTPADIAKCILKHKTAVNETQKLIDAQTKPAQPGDTITYSLTTKNISQDTIKQYEVKEDLNDVLDYASINNLHGGSVDKDNFVYWPPRDIAAGATITNQITIKVKSPIPATNTSPSDKNHFDLIMTNVYGDTVNIKLPCPAVKCAEVVTTTLPNTGPGSTVAIGFAITAAVAYFFARSRLMAKELDVVRDDYATTGGV